MPSHLDFGTLNNRCTRRVPNDLHKIFEANDSSKAVENWDEYLDYNYVSVKFLSFSKKTLFKKFSGQRSVWLSISLFWIYKYCVSEFNETSSNERNISSSIILSRREIKIGELSHSGRKKRRIERWKYIASKYLHWKARSVRGVHKAKCEKLRRRRKSEKGKVSSYVFPWRDFYGKCSEIDEIHRWLFPFHPVDATALLHAETNSSTRFIEKRGVGPRGSSEFVRPKIDSKDYFEGYREGERERRVDGSRLTTRSKEGD